LGADAENEQAVRRIFETKGRPADHPLIVHLARAELIHEGWASSVPPWAQSLADTVWPGPLTLILKRGPRASDLVTGGQGSVGLRVPAHPLTLRLLEVFGGGVAAPSANRFGRVSPTSAGAVLAELGDQFQTGDLILDGGSCTVGVESTIIDCTGDTPRLLRPGGISTDIVAAVTGLAVGQSDGSVRASGTLASHYSPQAKVVVTTAERIEHLTSQSTRAALIAPLSVATPTGVLRLAAPVDADQYARELYAALRTADQAGVTLVAAVPPSSGSIADAVIDRLLRAAAD
jgi:L-threonylcarbamoyladenylate synthase